MVYRDLDDIPSGHYRTILADPPWHYTHYSDKWQRETTRSRAVFKHYDTMTHDEIGKMDIGRIAARDSVLLLWATGACLHHALQVMEDWGFVYKTVGFVWVKMGKNGAPVFGMGQWTRSSVEYVLLGTKGHPRRQSASVRQCMMLERGKHSEKPRGIFDLVDSLVEGPKIELFARSTPPRGWDAFGDDPALTVDPPQKRQKVRIARIRPKC